MDAVVEAGLVREMVQRLYSDETRVAAAALRATGSVAAGNNDQTEALVQAGGVPIYRDLLAHPSRGLAREAAWILSNVTAGTPSQIQAVMDGQAVAALIQAAEEVRGGRGGRERGGKGRRLGGHEGIKVGEV